MPERFEDWRDSGLPPGAPGTVVTVGTFDGVHRGHWDVLERIAERSRSTGLRSVLVTFEPHPLEVVNPAAAPPLLTVGAEKSEVVAESGIDFMAIVPFTKTLQRYTAAQFVDEVLRKRFHVQHLVIGYDHGFGRGREGDVDVLRQLGHERGFGVEVVEAVMLEDGRPVSSTLIRRAVAGGDLPRATRALGRLYSVSGYVQHGDKRGRLLGFPTINLAPSRSPFSATPSEPQFARKLLPPEGVYAVRVQTPAGAFGGMMNLGPRPTFGDAAVSLEVHLFDAQVDLYEAYVKVEFVSRLRETRAFPSPEALVAQLGRDAEAARGALTRLS
jgi:riboflavin kinase/FMN adenylyltransferase